MTLSDSKNKTTRLHEAAESFIIIFELYNPKSHSPNWFNLGYALVRIR